MFSFKLFKRRQDGNKYYLAGGTGGSGGEGHNGVGGDGGQGTGASLNVDAQARYLNMSTHLHIDNRNEKDSMKPGNTQTDTSPYIQQNIHHHGVNGIDVLHRSAALEAIHDPIDSFAQPKCHPETRTQLLENLRKWALEPRPKTTILWLYGPAGAGKSAIMRTLAIQLHEDRRLGGCFFFKRGHAMRGNAKTLFATIAYQLALNIEWLRTPISKVVEKNPSLVARSMAVQMQELVSEPCRSHKHRDPVVILIDGLDECDGQGFQGEILRAIRNLSSNHPIFLRFIVASRPEPYIRQVFDSSYSHYRSFNVEQSFHDVRKYLCDEFSKIHRDHPAMDRIQSPWPKLYVLEALVRKSSGYFIYASTIIKFIGDENYRPTVRLEVVQNANGPGSESAYDALDQLYMTILSSAPRQSELIPILGAIVRFKLSPEQLDQLFRLAEGETRLLLRSLHSVLHIPPKLDEEVPYHGFSEISSHHASFLDFLNNPGRSRTFYVGALRHQIDLARSVLEAYVGPHENPGGFWSRFLDVHLMPFIGSLPPSTEVAELLPLIGAIDPECIFTSFSNEVPELMLAWLKKIPSAPRDLIKLWEDYDCMAFLEQAVLWRVPNHPSSKPIFLCSPEFLRILISLVVFRPDTLSMLRGRLDLTWTEMRTSICGPSSNVARDQHGLPALAVRLAFRDLALHCIRKMVENHLDIGGEVYSWESRDAALESIGRHQIDVDATEEHMDEQLVSVIRPTILFTTCTETPLYVRLHIWSDYALPALYSIGSFGPSQLSQRTSPLGQVEPGLSLTFPNGLSTSPIHHWNSLQFWKQACRFDSNLLDTGRLNYTAAELKWRARVKDWNETIVHLDLPGDLKLRLL
ncbi:hypothetical protein B0H14DRAFT_2441875 [Mycena olivaceomarginata]|nr:hypothetical protein B0H14DRAFT_2441875 [Mycena olivaceomarginata]